MNRVIRISCWCGLKNWAQPRGFSLVEVVLAIGVVSFAMLGVLALLPLGAKTNQVSAEETRAVNILVRLESDLRNARSTNSRFGLPLPYEIAGGKTVFSGSLAVSTNTVGLQDDETPGGASRYQASVIYLSVPPAGSLLPVRARLLVNWPALATTDPKVLVSMSQGYVEAFVTFPAP